MQVLKWTVNPHFMKILILNNLYFKHIKALQVCKPLSPTLCPNLNKRVQNSSKFKFDELLGHKGIYGFSDQILGFLIVDSTFEKDCHTTLCSSKWCFLQRSVSMGILGFTLERGFT